MDSNIQNELQLLMNIEKVDGQEQIKICSLLSQMLGCDAYVEKIKNDLDKTSNSPNFNLMIDFSQLLLTIINVNQDCSFKKEIIESRMKFIIYGVLYAYLLKNNVDLLNSLNLGDFRALYLNAVELILLIPQSVKVLQEDCMNCMGRVFGINCLVTKTKIN
jgi:hypothetical protein